MAAAKGGRLAWRWPESDDWQPWHWWLGGALVSVVMWAAWAGWWWLPNQRAGALQTAMAQQRQQQDDALQQALPALETAAKRWQGWADQASAHAQPLLTTEAAQAMTADLTQLALALGLQVEHAQMGKPRWQQGFAEVPTAWRVRGPYGALHQWVSQVNQGRAPLSWGDWQLQTPQRVGEDVVLKAEMRVYRALAASEQPLAERALKAREKKDGAQPVGYTPATDMPPVSQWPPDGLPAHWWQGRAEPSPTLPQLAQVAQALSSPFSSSLVSMPGQPAWAGLGVMSPEGLLLAQPSASGGPSSVGAKVPAAPDKVLSVLKTPQTVWAWLESDGVIRQLALGDAWPMADGGWVLEAVEGHRLTLRWRGEHGTHGPSVQRSLHQPLMWPQNPPSWWASEGLPLAHALPVLAQLQGMNISLPEGLKGEVNARWAAPLWHSVWTQVLAQHGLVATPQGGTWQVAVAPQSASPARQTVAVPLYYAKAADLAAQLKEGVAKGWLSAEGTWLLDERNNQLHVTDWPDRLGTLTAMVRAWDKPVQQIQIEAKIVEADERMGRSLGLKVLAGEGTAVAMPAEDMKKLNPATLANALFSASQTARLLAEIASMEQKGLKVVSSPHLITANHQPAEIEQGVEIPYQVEQDKTVSVRFRRASLQLVVTPKLSDSGGIMLDVTIEKNSPGQVLAGQLTINTNRLKTQVLVQDGGTVMIGGIYQAAQAQQTQQVPGLGDLPLIGGLFQRQNRSSDKTELLIFLTPKLLPSAVAQR